MGRQSEVWKLGRTPIASLLVIYAGSPLDVPYKCTCMTLKGQN